MDFRILGPLQAWDRGRPIELRRRKERALIAMLLLRAGEPVSSDELIDGLWGERPPRTAKAALQNSVAQLRRALGPGVLRSQAGGYLLEVTPEQVDLHRFERLVATAREADGEERVEKLRDALTLWRGPPLADLVFEPFASYEVERLQELRTATMEDLIDAELAVGAGAQLIGELESLVEAHPFRERFRGQLMLALYRGGRQADALAAYQETRRTLVDELGIEPSAPLRELEQAILRQDPSLDGPARSPREQPPPPEERRKTVTILLADLVFGDTVDPELAHEAAAKALTLIRGALESYEATTEQRAGDEVMAVFGLPRSHEDDALRAARAALELRSELRAQADLLELRVGIETGEVLAGADEAGHGFVSGPAISLAKRLLRQARPGEILAGPAALQLAGEAVLAEPAGDGGRLLDLVEGAPALARRLQAPLVGRRTELEALKAAFARMVEERGCRLFLLLGEAGIGKTRLATELAAELDSEATILVGRCASYGKGAAYLPLTEVIRRIEERRELAELLAGDEHAELIKNRLADLTGEAEAPASGGETFWAVRRVFEALAGEQPVVLVLEDLHWAEPTLLDLIDYLSERVADAPILVLGLARPELLEDRPDWSQLEATRLVALSPEEGEALLADLGEIQEELRAHIIRTAGGNPLFIEQLLAHALEDGEPETLPPTLDALLASRLDRLEAGELSVLQRASVPGLEFSREDVVQLVRKWEAAAVGARLQTLVRKGLVRETSREEAFRFQHALIHDAAYASLPKSQRAKLHERFARRLEARSGPDELIGYHLERACRYLVELETVGDRAAELAAEAGARLGRAGLRGWRRADAATTVDLLRRAVHHLPQGDATRLELLPELGLALRTTGEIEQASEILGEAVETASAAGERRIELRARLELANVRLSSRSEESAEELLEITREAIPTLEALGDDRALGRAWLLLGYVRGGFHCQNDEWNRAAERSLVHYRRSRWPTAACFGEIAASLFYGSTPVPAAIRRCGELLGEVSDLGGEAHVLVWLGGLEAFAGRLNRGRELVARAKTIYEELGYRIMLGSASGAVLGEIELLADRPDAAEESLRKSCAVLEAMQEAPLLASRASELADAIYRQGRYGEAGTWARLSREHAASDDTSAQLLWRAVQAKTLARGGLFTEAEALAREAVALAEQTDGVNRQAKVQLDLAEVLRLGGKSAEAIRSIELALELFERKGNRVGAEHARLLLGDGLGAARQGKAPV